MIQPAALLLTLALAQSAPPDYEVFWVAVEAGRKFEEHPIADLAKVLPPDVCGALDRNPYFKPDPAKKVRARPTSKKEGFQVWFDDSHSVFLLVGARPTNRTVDIFKLGAKAVETIKKFDEDLGTAFGDRKPRPGESWRAKLFVQLDGRRQEGMVDALYEAGELDIVQLKAMKESTSYYDVLRGNVFVAPGLEESRMDHEVIHMLAHLVSYEMAGTLPYWIQEAIAWDLEMRVLGYVRSYCRRAGFVASRGQGWERASISSVPIAKFLEMAVDPTDKEIIGMLRLVRKLMENRPAFLKFLKGFQQVGLVPLKVEVGLNPAGMLTLTEIPESPPYRMSVQKLLLLQNYGSLPADGPVKPDELLGEVRLYSEGRWLQLFQQAVNGSPQKDAIVKTGKLLKAPGSDRLLPIAELLAIQPKPPELEKDLAVLAAPFDAWSKAMEKTLLRREK